MSIKYFWHERRVAAKERNFKVGYYDGHTGLAVADEGPDYRRGYSNGIAIALAANKLCDKQTKEFRHLEAKLQACHDHMGRVSRAVAVT